MSAPVRPPLERRGLHEGAQLQAAPDRPLLTGYALKFGVRSEPLTGPQGVEFVEEIAPDALARLRERRDVKALIGHDATRVVGSTKAGTLALTVDADGLRFRLQPPDSPEGLSLVESVRRGDLDGVSFGFRTLRDDWQDGAPLVRVLRDLDLFEISFVAWPAYREAGVMIEARARSTPPPSSPGPGVRSAGGSFARSPRVWPLCGRTPLPRHGSTHPRERTRLDTRPHAAPLGSSGWFVRSARQDVQRGGTRRRTHVER